MNPLTAAALALGLLAIGPLAAQESPLAATVVAQTQSNQAAAQTQKSIDQMADETARMLEEYRGVLRRIDSLEAYNKQIEKIVASQDKEIASYLDQLERLETTNREVLPLMVKMIDALEQFVKLDIPFLPGERQDRLKNLRELMDRADIKTSEKYRSILEAYQIEMEYGRTIEATRGSQTMNGVTRDVDFLRFGRIGLYYQTLDGEEVGCWDSEAHQWKVLDASYRFGVREGLQIARKQVAPDLIKLPVPAPTTAK
jgi:septal ring factor EnvC (AmiA/AmiB activator)